MTSRDTERQVRHFLKALAIKRRKSDVQENLAWWQSAADALGIPLPDEPPATNSPLQGRLMFATDRHARDVLGADLERIEAVLCKVAELAEVGQLERVVELGGGVGLPSLFLASRSPSTECLVTDHSPGPLKIGEQWASKLGAGNVRFRSASLVDLADDPTLQPADLVIAASSIALSLDCAGVEEPLRLAGDPVRRLRDEWAGMAKSFALAARRTLAPGGILFWSGAVDPAAAEQLLGALREVGLAIDWYWSSVVGTKPAGRAGQSEREKWHVKHIHIFFSDDLPHLLPSSRDDARAIFSLAARGGEIPWVPDTEFYSWSDLFADGVEVGRVEYAYDSGGRLRKELRYRDGLVLCRTTTTRGLREAFLHSAAALPEIWLQINAEAEEIIADGHVRVTHKECNGPLREFLQSRFQTA